MGCDRGRSLGSWNAALQSRTGSAAWVLVRGAITFVLVSGRTVPASAQQLASGVPSVVFDGVNVVDVEQGKLLPSQRVVITGNRIAAVGSAGAVTIPEHAEVVDARGKYLIPGLWDVHIHPDALLPTAALIQHRVNAVFAQVVAAGITGIRIPGSQTSLDSFRVWKREIAAGHRVGPRLIVSGPSINDSRLATYLGCPPGAPAPPCEADGSGPHGPDFGQYGHVRLIADDEDAQADARHVVDSLKAAGADMLKFRDVPRPVWFALAREARRAGIPFGGHFIRYEPWENFAPATDLPATVDGLVASDSGARILDHELWADVCGWSADSVESLPQCAAAAARLRRNGTWVNVMGMGGSVLPDSVRRRVMRYGNVAQADPTGQAWQLPSAAERRGLPMGAELAAAVSDSARQGKSCRQVRLAHAADLPWLPGDDFPFGFVLATPLSLLQTVLCGAPPLWALQAATLEPARAFGLADSLGTVAIGKVADLVLLEGDPLADIWAISRIAGVVTNGRYFDRAALDQLLIEANREWLQVIELEREQRPAEP